MGLMTNDSFPFSILNCTGMGFSKSFMSSLRLVKNDFRNVISHYKLAVNNKF